MRLPGNKQGFVGPMHHGGFTLVEVMVAVVIVAILAALAYPSYRDAVVKTKRAEARVALLQLMQQQERYYSQHTGYIAFSSDSTRSDAKRFKWFSGDSPKASAYEISGAACDGEAIQDCIKLTASPGTAKVNASYTDAACGELTLTSTGMKASGARHSQCW